MLLIAGLWSSFTLTSSLQMFTTFTHLPLIPVYFFWWTFSFLFHFCMSCKTQLWALWTIHLVFGYWITLELKNDNNANFVFSWLFYIMTWTCLVIVSWRYPWDELILISGCGQEQHINHPGFILINTYHCSGPNGKMSQHRHGLSQSSLQFHSCNRSHFISERWGH